VLTEPTVDSLSVAGMLLTGGASRRMGIDKASIVIGGLTCAEMIGARLSAVVVPSIEVGPGRSGLAAFADEAPGSGPLAAMATGWKALREEGHRGAVIVLACDLPEISVAFLDFLARFPGEGTVVPVVNGRVQPLCARFSSTSLDMCRDLVAGGGRSLNGLLKKTAVAWLGQEEWSTVTDERCFADIDTPEDLARVAGSDDEGFKPTT
jgi:molybdopterin-guanine dinucleotide biosynthesis protein A